MSYHGQKPVGKVVYSSQFSVFTKNSLIWLLLFQVVFKMLLYFMLVWRTGQLVSRFYISVNIGDWQPDFFIICPRRWIRSWQRQSGWRRLGFCSRLNTEAEPTISVIKSERKEKSWRKNFIMVKSVIINVVIKHFIKFDIYLKVYDL